MKIEFIAKTFLVVVLSFAASQSINAQYAYGLSELVYDPVSKKVATKSVTELDFIAGLHYDPAVVGDVYQEGMQAGIGYNKGFAHIRDAVVRMRSINPAPPNTHYDLYSDHYVVAYFYTTVIILDDPPPGVTRSYYDPLGFGALGGGKNPGWFEYQGSERREQFGNGGSAHFYLGTTGVGLTSPDDPPTCLDGVTLLGNGCPDNLTVQITNQYVNGDLSGTTKKGLLGAKALIETEVQSDSTAPKTYQWKVNGVNDETTASLLSDFSFGTNTISVDVTQGNITVNKSFTLEIELPKIVENVPDIPISEDGFYGIERPPNITDAMNPCGRGTSQNFLTLGCLTTFPITMRKPEDINIAGLYAKVTVAPPDNFITDGQDSWVEIKQIIKPTVVRTGVDGNGIRVTECIEFDDDAAPNGYRTDRSGRYNPLDPPGYKIAAQFRNNQSGASAREVLDFIDGPGFLLEESNGNGGVINDYFTDQDFKTYVTYFSNSFESQGVPFGTYSRKALAVMSWKWRANVKKPGNTWVFDYKSPTIPANLPSTPIQYLANSTGEIPYDGFIEGADYVPCENFQPIRITTPSNVAVWRKNNGVWYIVNPDGTTTATQWGVDYDIPVPGDYDGDGLADFAVFRPDDPATTTQDECAGGCVWYVLKSSDGNWQPSYFGIKDDKPTPADFDGDGITDVAVFRPSTNTWHIMRSSDGGYYNLQFGVSSDVPVPSDYDGDGIDDVAMWSPTNATWSVLNSSSQVTTVQSWGTYSDIPVIGDYDGDGKTDFANWQSNGNWHILLSADGQIKTVNFGVPSTDTPVPGNYDGDEKTDIAVWRPNGSQTAQWYIMRSSDDQMEVRHWGLAGDIPIPAAYRR